MKLDATSRALTSLSRLYRAGHRVTQQLRPAREIRRLRSDFYRSVWREAAHSAGASFVEMNGSLLEMRSGEVVLRVRRHVTSLDDPVTLKVAGDKSLVYGLLEAAHLPVPCHTSCSSNDLSTAWRFVAGLRRPCVVKPARGTGGGAGITTGVTSKARLAAAMVRAGAFCPDVVVEQHVEGDNYRLLYFDGELLDAVLRSPPAVLGDGNSSLKELIRQENARRLREGIETSQALLRIDRELRHTLGDRGLTLRSTPSRDEVVPLKRVVSENRAQENEAATDRLCASIVETGAHAAATVGVRLAGVDVICADPAVPLTESGGVIIEVNTTPSLYYHYMKRPGPTDVAGAILARLTGGRA